MKKLIFLVIFALVAACSPPPNDSADLQQTKNIEVFYVTDTPRGFKLVSEIKSFTTNENNFGSLVIKQLISGELQPTDPDYVNLWDQSHGLNQVLMSGARATIDFNLGKLNVGSEGELRAIEQLVWTLTGISPFLTTVRFLVNGESIDTFAGHLDTTVNFKRSPAYEVLNPIQITSLTDGEVLTNPIVITGQACTFEANVVWELKSVNQVIERGFTTADVACPTRSKFEVKLPNIPAGEYMFEAKEFSAEDGSLFAIDTKKIIIKE